MVNVNYQCFGSTFGLRLRLYKDGEVRYVSVNKLLRGAFKKRQWNQKRQCFTKSAPLFEENNRILEEFRKPYDSLAKTWAGSLSGFLLAVKPKEKKKEAPTTLRWLMCRMIVEKKLEKHKDGSMKGTYGAYEKTVRRLKEFFAANHQDYNDIQLADITVDLVNDILDFLESERGEGCKYYVSLFLRAALNWGDKMGYFDFSKLKGVR